MRSPVGPGTLVWDGATQPATASPMPNTKGLAYFIPLSFAPTRNSKSLLKSTSRSGGSGGIVNVKQFIRSTLMLRHLGMPSIA
jgi:hypothetical protein